MQELERETSVAWPTWCYSGEAQNMEESPQIAASPSLLVAAAAAAAATTIVSRRSSQSPKAAKLKRHKSSSMSPSPATFKKMLTDHMLSNLQDARKFPLHQIHLPPAKSYADVTGDFSENAVKNQIKTERLSPLNLKTANELESNQPSPYSRSPSETPTPSPRASPRTNESSRYTPSSAIRLTDREDSKQPRSHSEGGGSSSFLPPPPNHFNARNYSDIMRSLAAKYNSSSDILQPSVSFGSSNEGRCPSRSKPAPETSYAQQSQHNPNSTNPALNGLLNGFRLSQAATFPPFMDMSSTQTLLMLAKIAKEAEVQRLKSSVSPKLAASVQLSSTSDCLNESALVQIWRHMWTVLRQCQSKDEQILKMGELLMHYLSPKNP